MSARIAAPGFYPDLDADAYFSEPCPEPALTNTCIGHLRNRTPAYAARRHPAIGETPDERTATLAMVRGNVVHRIALGRGKDFDVVDAPGWRTKDARAMREAIEAEGRVAILAKDYEKAVPQASRLRAAIDDICQGHPWQSEVVIGWQRKTPHGPIWGRGMLDVWCENLMLIVDVKTTTNASPDAAYKRIVDGGYDIQNRWYTSGVEAILKAPGRVEFVTLFSEIDEPYETAPYRLDEAFKQSADDEIEIAARSFAACLRAGEWPGYERLPQTLSAKPWLIGQRMDRQYEEAA